MKKIREKMNIIFQKLKKIKRIQKVKDGKHQSQKIKNLFRRSIQRFQVILLQH